MPRQRIGVAPLTGGVSKQPPANRFQSQTETSDNTLLCVNRGLEKRYGGIFIAGEKEDDYLNYTGDPSAAKFHSVERDDDNVFFLFVDKSKTGVDTVQAFRSDGTKITVTDNTSGAAITYLKSGSDNAVDGLVLKTYGDTTFILNKEVVTALTGTAASYTFHSSSPVNQLAVPSTATIGQYLHLIQTDVGYPSGYYEVLDRTVGIVADTGPWYRRNTTPFDNSEIDPTTMPYTLVYDPSSGGSLSLEEPVWNDRLSGDDVTNPGPSFIGKTLNDITVFQDRLWISAEQQVVSSQAGDLYNFWVDDWTTLVDSDPIDITLSGSSVNAGQFLIPFNKTMVIIADGAKQWEVQSLDSFTPTATNLVETTTYQVDPGAYPVQIGNQLYFASDQGQYSFIWEYFPNFDRDANVGDNITSHVEEYIPNNIRRIETSENNNMLFAWSSDEVNTLYVYTTMWQISEKLQSSWCRWVFDPNATLLGHSAIDNFLYVFLELDGDMWMEKVPITPPVNTSDGTNADGIGYHAHVDKKVVVTGTYSAATKTTSFVPPFEDDEMDTVILGDQWVDKRGQVISSETTTGGGTTTLTVSGDYSAHPVILGKSYEMSVQLTRPFIKDENQIVVQGNVQIKTIDMLFKDTTTFNVEVTPSGRPAKIRKFNAARWGSSVFGQSSTEEFGRFRTQVFGSAADTVIMLKNNTAFPSLFTSLEYIVNFVPSRDNPTKR